MTYSLLVRPGLAGVVRDADGAVIPADPRNVDWQAYRAWLAEGNAPTPAPASPPAPVTLTFLQFMALFTPAEQAALVSSTDTQTRLFLMMATGAGLLDLANEEVVAGVNYVAQAATATQPGPGLIAPARVGEILAGQPPA